MFLYDYYKSYHVERKSQCIEIVNFILVDFICFEYSCYISLNDATQELCDEKNIINYLNSIIYL